MSDRFIATVLNLDRRLIYLAVTVLLVVPLLTGLKAAVRTTREVENVHAFIDGLQPGDALLLSADFGPSTYPETYPVLRAALHQCFQKQLRPVIVTLVPDGRFGATRALREVLESTGKDGQPLYPGLQDGVDYAFLGYKAGGSAVILGMGQSIEATFPADGSGRSLRELEIFSNIKRLSDFKGIFDIASVGYPEVWLPFGSQRYHVPLLVSCTSISAVSYYPYVLSGQFVGLVNGMKGASEYDKLVGVEELTGQDSQPAIGMVGQGWSQTFIILAIILANACYFVERRRRGQGVAHAR